VCLQIDWPIDEVEFPVEILVRNRGSLRGLLVKSIIWAERLGIVRDLRRQAWGKQIPRGRLRSIGAHQTRHRALVSTSRLGLRTRFNS
jgi:hypothetical protein